MLVAAVCLWLGPADFSGTWTFDRAASSRPGPDGRIVIAPILGEECTAVQDATGLTLTIKAGALNVTAVYRFNGESRNLSPGQAGAAAIPVISRVSWKGNTLVIHSRSTSQVNRQEIVIETTRVLWLDEGGATLVIERTGTPASEVTPSRSVYRRLQGGAQEDSFGGPR